jgi:hypothetical protein
MRPTGPVHQIVECERGAGLVWARDDYVVPAGLEGIPSGADEYFDWACYGFGDDSSA